MSTDPTQAGTKRCARCEEHKLRAEFPGDARRKDGLHPYCRICVRRASKAYYVGHTEAVIARTTQWAKDNPDANRAKVAKWRAGNKGAITARKSAEYHANKEAIDLTLRNAHFKRKFGITLADRDALAAAHDNRCAICGLHESNATKRHAVDHDHSSGAVRGLLCQSCNLGLGFFRDDPERMEAAALYLRRYQLPT